MSRPANPPEDASGMRCLGCGYYDDEPQTQGRMCEGGEGVGHAFVRVGPDGCVPAPDDDPATLRARLEERYERPERPCTYDPADEEPEAEPVAPTPEDRLRSHLRALAHESQRADDWTPPRPEPVEYAEEREPCQVCEGGTRYVCVQCAAAENSIRRAIRAAIERGDGDKGVSFTFAVTDPIARDVYTDPVTGLLDFPAVAPQGGPDPRNDVRGPSKKRFSDASARADEILRHPLTGTSTWDTLTLPPGGDAIERTAYDASTHTGEDPVPTTTIIDRAILEEVARDLPKSYADVTGWTNQIVDLFRCGCGARCFWSPTEKDDAGNPLAMEGEWGYPPGEVRPHTCPPADPALAPAVRERLDRDLTNLRAYQSATRDPGYVEASVNLRSYLRTLTNPDATPEDVNGALDTLTPEDRALVTAAVPATRPVRE